MVSLGDHRGALRCQFKRNLDVASKNMGNMHVGLLTVTVSHLRLMFWSACILKKKLNVEDPHNHLISRGYFTHKQPCKHGQPTCTQTSANNHVILLSCDFLFSPSLHQQFRGQEDLSAVTERIMGVGIPLAVITALSQHPVLSLLLFSYPLSFCLFSLLSSDRLRSN